MQLLNFRIINFNYFIVAAVCLICVHSSVKDAMRCDAWTAVDLAAVTSDSPTTAAAGSATSR